jgi:hypothetical protein
MIWFSKAFTSSIRFCSALYGGERCLSDLTHDFQVMFCHGLLGAGPPCVPARHETGKNGQQ